MDFKVHYPQDLVIVLFVHIDWNLYILFFQMTIILAYTSVSFYTI